MDNYKFSILFLWLAFISVSCSNGRVQIPEPSPAYEDLLLAKKPNILWLVAEDLGPYIPSFGDSTIETPHLSRLASEGICFDNVFSPSGVCAPSRAALITGMYPNSIGAGHMRTGPWYNDSLDPAKMERYKIAAPENIPPYEAVPPPEVRMFTEYLRTGGYYCSNNSKEDYQFRKTMTAWDESGKTAHWRHRRPGQPFFSVFNFGVTHESQIWTRAGDSLWVDKNLDVPVPPYLPNTEIGKQDISRMYSNIKIMDKQIGDILGQLEEDNLLDSTIIIWYTDHGGPLPRMKRMCYDSGLKVPMIIRFPDSQLAGLRDTQLISFIDFAPTTLSIAGIQPPDHLDGQSFLGEFSTMSSREYIHAAADRFDEKYDKIRAVRNHRFKYIRYYEREKPMLLAVNYREQMPIMQELRRLDSAGMLTAVQAQWFRTEKPEEELFDIKNDPHELHDLSTDPAFFDILNELRTECTRWITDIDDSGIIPEEQLVNEIWPEGIQPATENPRVQLSGNHIALHCETPGASIGYKILFEEQDTGSWLIYKDAFEMPGGSTLSYVAHRIGYFPSKVQLYNPDN